MEHGFVKVATGTPHIKVADCAYNAEQIIALFHQAEQEQVDVLTLPELCLTGYTCGDLFFQSTLLDGAKDALATILDATTHSPMVIALGLPLFFNNKLFNCAAVIQSGIILGVVPKTFLPNYGEFYEQRWFTKGQEMGDFFSLCGQDVFLGTDLIFPCETMPNLVIGVEICEDLWATTPPSVRLCESGATLILNLSASDEVIGKADYRRQLISSHSARLLCGYVYANAGDGESTTDVVFGGHNIISEYGSILAESRFQTGLTISEIDVDKLAYERRRMTTFPPVAKKPAYHTMSFALPPAETKLTRTFSQSPFVPTNLENRASRCQEILTITALGLKKRLEHTHAKTAVIGLSGGLDSTLALLITKEAMDLLNRPASDIVAVTMPCFGTTERTKSNAVLLAETMGVTLKTIDISNSVLAHFTDIEQDPNRHDVTFENGQARERTQVLMDLANQLNGLVIGTGDLSELALGWATYNGDHMSMYAVNSSIPKTLVRHLVSYVAEQETTLNPVLTDILDTPVSPELLPAVDGNISQITEALVGPYQLHDFFLYYVVRWAFPPAKILYLAECTFAGIYNRATILNWLTVFYRRFFGQQFKRSCLPDGPKVGSVTLSPRGDWRMPSDAMATLWLSELEHL